MANRREQYHRVLSKYLPEDFVDQVTDLLIKHTVHFKIVKPRKTKLGDFRVNGPNDKPQITVNGDLNPYAFLVTTLHEFAHLLSFQEYGPRIAPHGPEWKQTYRELLYPVLESNALPDRLKKALEHSILHMKASSSNDLQLQRVLLTFDERDDNMTTLESLEKNSTFALNGRIFLKGKLRRTRYLCTEIRSGRQFLISALAQVEEKHGE